MVWTCIPFLIGTLEPHKGINMVWASKPPPGHGNEQGRLQIASASHSRRIPTTGLDCGICDGQPMWDSLNFLGWNSSLNLIPDQADWDVERFADKNKHNRPSSDKQLAESLAKTQNYFPPGDWGHLDMPATIVDKHGHIMAWHLDGLLGEQRIVCNLFFWFNTVFQIQYRMIIIRPSLLSNQPSKHLTNVKTKTTQQARTTPQRNHGVSRDSDPHQIVFLEQELRISPLDGSSRAWMWV